MCTEIPSKRVAYIASRSCHVHLIADILGFCGVDVENFISESDQSEDDHPVCTSRFCIMASSHTYCVKMFNSSPGHGVKSG